MLAGGSRAVALTGARVQLDAVGRRDASLPAVEYKGAWAGGWWNARRVVPLLASAVSAQVQLGLPLRTHACWQALPACEEPATSSVVRDLIARAADGTDGWGPLTQAPRGSDRELSVPDQLLCDTAVSVMQQTLIDAWAVLMSRAAPTGHRHFGAFVDAPAAAVICH